MADPGYGQRLLSMFGGGTYQAPEDSPPGYGSRLLQAVTPTLDSAVDRFVGQGYSPGQAFSTAMMALPAGRAMPSNAANLARLDRASSMGFNIDEPLYHGSADSFQRPLLNKAGSSIGSPKQRAVFLSTAPSDASKWAEIASGYRYPEQSATGVAEGAQVYPMYLRGRQKQIEMDAYRGNQLANEIAQARKEGFDSLRIRGMADMAGGADQVAVLKPQNLRSTFAQFDPAKITSRNLLAGSAGATIAPFAFDDNR